MNLLAPQSSRWLSTLRRQDGVSMIIMLGVMLVTSLLVVTAFTSANGEVHLTATDRAQKKAYYAAEAGLENYEYHLTQDGNYLTYCTSPTPENPALNQYFKEGTEIPLKASELHTAEVPEVEGRSSEEKYAIALVPAVTNKEKTRECNKNNVVGSMIEEKEGPAAGTFRIASTGFSGKETRTLVATFRNANFVSYVWYSVYETGDPSLYGATPEKEPTTYWTECGKFYKVRPNRCNKFNNYFISGEKVNGPMHTEDHVGICGKPVFGRTRNDRIEFGGGNEKGSGVKGYSTQGVCGEANPEFKGLEVPPSETKQITPPPGNEELEHLVEPSYHFNGETEIVLTGSTMTVTEHKGAGASTEKTTTGVAFPPNGVIYVSEGTCERYSPFGPNPGYTEGSTCGDVYVHGTKYTKSLTIAAQNDIIINGNITTEVNGEGVPTTNAMLGLIANNFVRVAHPVGEIYKREGSKCKEESYEKGLKILDKETSPKSEKCEYTNEAVLTKSGSEYSVVDACNAPNLGKSEGELESPEIYAAILALNHAFIVDNFDCGKPNLGSLKVYGAIAGEFTNGMTGVFSGTTPLNGYPVNLIYDNRLQAAEPPHFLNPVQAAWYIQRQTLASNP